MRDVQAALLDRSKWPGNQAIKPEQVDVRNEEKFTLRAPPGHDLAFFELQALKAALPKLVICGVPTARRVVINKTDTPSGDTLLNLLVEGYGMLEVLNIPGIVASRSRSNHIHEVEKCLGIEAARAVIMKE